MYAVHFQYYNDHAGKQVSYWSLVHKKKQAIDILYNLSFTATAANSHLTIGMTGRFEDCQNHPR
jgi:hypothetical protein